jgi:hypothetical protein
MSEKPPRKHNNKYSAYLPPYLEKKMVKQKELEPSSQTIVKALDKYFKTKQ